MRSRRCFDDRCGLPDPACDPRRSTAYADPSWPFTTPAAVRPWVPSRACSQAAQEGEHGAALVLGESVERGARRGRFTAVQRNRRLDGRGATVVQEYA